jgi:type IV pilus assembly protein PilA
VHPRTRNHAGFTLLELVVVIAIVGVLVAMAMAGTRTARIRAAESAAIAALSAINQGQFAFMQSCGHQRYAPTLVALGTPAPGFDTGFISPDLAMSDPLEKSGYVFQLSGTPSVDGALTCTGLVPLDSYRLTADPVVPGSSGDRFFGTNTDRVIYAGVTSFADDMPESGPPQHGEEIR